MTRVLTNYPIPVLSLRWLYVDFNSYFASVEQQLRLELRGKPIAAVPVETDSTCAIAASYEAKAFGVKTGTVIHEAKRLCPGLVCVLARHECYVEFHHRLIEEIERHIPVTAVCSIDEVAGRLMDNEISVERSTEIAQSIKSGIANNIGPYMRCSIGIAPKRYRAKVGTELQKPDGLVVLCAADLPQKLFSLKLRDLPGIGANIEHRIQMAGIMDLRGLLRTQSGSNTQDLGQCLGRKGVVSVARDGIAGRDNRPAQRRPQPCHGAGTAGSDQGQGCCAAPDAEGCQPPATQAVFMRVPCRFRPGWKMIRTSKPKSAFTGRRTIRPSLISSTGSGLRRSNKAVVSGSEKFRSRFQTWSRQPIYRRSCSRVCRRPIWRRRGKSEKLSRAMDKINHRFGRDSILIGMTPSQGRSFSGSKITFTPLPDVDEFLE